METKIRAMGPPKPDPTEKSGGGKKDPDDSDDSEGSKDPPPPPSDHSYPEVWEDGFGEGIDRYRSRTPRGKEADSIKFLAFPNGSQWRAWRAHCIQAVIAATGRHDDEAFPWIRACARERPEDLQEPGPGWISLDRKIAAALMLICHGELGRELTQMFTTMYNNDQIVRGRSLLAFVFRYYASSQNGQVLYDLNHLQGLKWLGTTLKGFITPGIWRWPSCP